MNPCVLLVDDDRSVGTVLMALLQQAGIECAYTSSRAEALEALDRRHFDAMVTDVRMEGMDGLELMRAVHETLPSFPVVIITAHGTIPLAVEAMKSGAAEFMTKPFDREEILFVVRKVLEISRRSEADVPAAPHVQGGMIGRSASMRALYDRMKRVAPSVATVLLTGETGTGKGLVARGIHDDGPRRSGPFVSVQCGALPADLLESELFGYEKGAFTGAVAAKPGRVELAAGGTLFIDEVGDIPMPLQVRLLRLLQEREYERLGATETSQADVRFISATHRDLAQMVADGNFREDLYFRLDVIPIEVPPLRDRVEDIPELAQHLCAVYGERNGRPEVTLGADAEQRLAEYAWPGNVRQLQNIIERLVVLVEDPRLTAASVDAELARLVHPAVQPVSDDVKLVESRFEAGRSAVERALVRSRGNRTQAARLLGISRRTLYNRLEEFDLA